MTLLQPINSYSAIPCDDIEDDSNCAFYSDQASGKADCVESAWFRVNCRKFCGLCGIY